MTTAAASNLCNVAGSAGTCKTVTGTSSPPRGACPGSGVCQAACTGGASCSYPSSSTQCDQTCSNGSQTTYFCNGAGSCANFDTQPCASGQVCCANACCTRLTACGPAQQCGSISDNCGGRVSCGVCPKGVTCLKDNICNQ